MSSNTCVNCNTSHNVYTFQVVQWNSLNLWAPSLNMGTKPASVCIDCIDSRTLVCEGCNRESTIYRESDGVASCNCGWSTANIGSKKTRLSDWRFKCHCDIKMLFDSGCKCNGR